tara:strand:+ start:107 stop:940 length:834 start_codon:yes stop_codon:yes gene_type:complete
MNKLAFIFLIYSTINHESIWYDFFKNVDKSKYNIYIHYKTDVKLEYFDEYKAKNIINTKYADISIVKAQNYMLKEALLDVDNTHFIFLSGSCIPFKSFDYIYNILDSKFSYFHIADKEECLPDCREALNYIDIEYLNKASQWCILNRKHSILLINGANYYNHVYNHNTLNYLVWFNNSYAPDELCYLTFLARVYNNNLKNEIIATYYKDPPEYATTFANWEGMNYKYVSHNELKNYVYISENELTHLINSPCLFGRKFKQYSEYSLRNNIYIHHISS